MKIGIHKRKGSFSEYWVSFCKKNNIPYKIVNCYNTDIIEQLSDCDVLMWNHHHGIYKDTLIAKPLLYALEQAGKKVFPDFNTAWHFDDKIGQKYLLESINAPLVPSYVFFDKKSAKDWINRTNFPKVFKLRGGAGSSNVSLIKTKSEAIKKVNIAFGRGFVHFKRVEYFLEHLKKFRKRTINLKELFYAFVGSILSTQFSKMKGREKGYAYFQDFIPNNSSDIRIIVVGNKAFGIKRMVRKNDFRASGSGIILYDKNLFDEKTIKLAFDVSKKLKTKICAFDFVYDSKKTSFIVEISYAFSSKGYEDCVGYWDNDLVFYPGTVTPQDWVMEELLH